MDNIEARAQRERDAHNEGLSRSNYNRLLRPSKLLFQKRRFELAHDALAPCVDGPILEIGSTVWSRWIDKNGLVATNLTCINVSEVELEAGRVLAADSWTKPKFLLMDAQKLDFDDNSFNAVFGGAILHHLELKAALSEIDRVLRPGGVFFFAEPLDMNPVGRLVRALTPKARTEDERPFRMRDFRMISERFQYRCEFESFLSVPVGVLSALLGLKDENVLIKGAYHVDRALSAVPGLGYWYRYVVMEGTPRN